MKSKSTKENIIFSECDLFDPVKLFFEKQGFKVNGEVKNCDLTAFFQGKLIVVELKKSFNLKLVYQGIKRQKITPFVYICVPRPKKTRSTTYTNMVEISKRIGLGLMTVAIDSPLNHVEILVEPSGIFGKQCNNKRNSILREIEGRNIDINKGGSKGKINTAFREKNIKIACILEKENEITAKRLVRDFSCEKDAYSLLYKNHYGWFCRTGKGVYSLTSVGESFLESNEFGEVVAYYRKLFNTNLN